MTVSNPGGSVRRKMPNLQGNGKSEFHEGWMVKETNFGSDVGAQTIAMASFSVL